MSLVASKWQKTDAATRELEILLFCGVCDIVVQDPCILRGCDHFFCRKCTSEVASNGCPTCGIPSHVKDVLPSRQLATTVSLCRKLLRITQGLHDPKGKCDGGITMEEPHVIDPDSMQQTDEDDQQLEQTKLCEKANHDNNDGKKLSLEAPSNPLDVFDFVMSPSTASNDKSRRQTRNKTKVQKKKQKLARLNKSWGVDKDQEDDPCGSCKKIKSGKGNRHVMLVSPSARKNDRKEDSAVADDNTAIAVTPTTRNLRRKVSIDAETSFTSLRQPRNGESVAMETDENAHKELLTDKPTSKTLEQVCVNTTLPSVARKKTTQIKTLSENTPRGLRQRGVGINALQTPPSSNKNKSPNVRALRKATQSPRIPDSPMNLEKKNSKGETPLHVSTIKGDTEKVRELLKAGANPNVKDNAGWTPLHEAVNHGFLEISQLLLDNGAFVNTPGMDNDTPLHDAVQCNQVECARLLVSRGASIEMRNVHGYTAVDLAKSDSLRQVLKKTKVISSMLTDDCPSLAPVMKNSRMVILGTGLRRDQKSQLSKCASMLHSTCVTEFSPEVTHVISCTNEKGMCPRTLKYLQAVLTGKWILRYEWVEHCLEYGQSVCEEAFEIPGSSSSPDSHAPSNGRRNFEKQLPGLLDGFNFFLSGNFKYPTPSKDELTRLIKLGGGKFLTREPKVESLSEHELTVPYHAKKESSLRDCSQLIVYDPNDKKAKVVRSRRACSVPATWLMDCVAHFEILDLPEK